nr:PREDICTED: histone deacetylase 11 [Bemisia tabaci]
MPYSVTTMSMSQDDQKINEFTDKRGKRRSQNQWPIVYSKEYDVKLCGLQKLHPFDAEKWRHIFLNLKKENMLSDETVSTPVEADAEMLLLVHTQKYLNSLKWSWKVAKITEIPAIAIIPNWIINQRYLKPMRFQVGGSVLAGELAIHRGWSINIGGGFHHCSGNEGGGFCSYADITLLIKWLFKFYPQRVKTAMIVDLDAHQGNGHERDFFNDEKVFIMDVFNREIYPRDSPAKEAIKCMVELESYTSDSEYLDLVERKLERSLHKFHPDILVYNAGTDILSGDPLGRLDISAEGIIRRDEIVFMKARERRVPIVMLTSGGYLKKTAEIISRSILNLEALNLISR